jgi:hypothetical protein
MDCPTGFEFGKKGYGWSDDNYMKNLWWFLNSVASLIFCKINKVSSHIRVCISNVFLPKQPVSINEKKITDTTEKKLCVLYVYQITLLLDKLQLLKNKNLDVPV